MDLFERLHSSKKNVLTFIATNGGAEEIINIINSLSRMDDQSILNEFVYMCSKKRGGLEKFHQFMLESCDPKKVGSIMQTCLRIKNDTVFVGLSMHGVIEQLTENGT